MIRCGIPNCNRGFPNAAKLEKHKRIVHGGYRPKRPEPGITPAVTDEFTQLVVGMGLDK